MKKLLLLFIPVLYLNSASIKDLNITRNDIIKINSTIEKKAILSRLLNYNKLIKTLKNEKDPLIIVKKVNSYFNKFKSITDKKNFNKNDYWATRKEFILKGGGDCEDFVIAKYFTLIDLGINHKNLFPILTKYKEQPHLVLGYQHNLNKEFMILDSINKEVKKRDDINIVYKITSNNNINESNKISFEITNYKWNQVIRRN